MRTLRQAGIEELVAAPPSPELRALARPALRALVRDSAERHVADGDLLRRRLLEVRGDLIAVVQLAPAGVALSVVSPHARRRIARLQLDGALAVSMRLGDAGSLTIADDRGRLIVVDLLRATLRRDLRIS